MENYLDAFLDDIEKKTTGNKKWEYLFGESSHIMNDAYGFEGYDYQGDQ